MESSLFPEVGDALRGIVPADLGVLRLRAHRYGIKVWFGPEKATKEHYEAQVVGARDVPAARTLALEVGFHSEHSKPAANDEVIARIVAHEKQWRREVGTEAEVAPFLGRAENWRRVSETWLDPDLTEPGLAFEIASRLVDYITAIEPLVHPG
ncbi:MAG: hypothetical protein JJE46_01480 [Acidimicrobiia bacterium]|nr:hypothetical protein [Acidimicrobiia bacterium]